MTGAWIFLGLTCALWMLHRENKRRSSQIDEWTESHYRRRNETGAGLFR